MVRIWLAVCFVIIIGLLGTMERWLADESIRLKANRLMMLKELKAASFIASKKDLISEKIAETKQLPSKQRAEKKMISFFDMLRKHWNIALLKKFSEENHILTAEVKISFKSVDKESLKELLSLELQGGILEVSSFNFESGRLELIMRWYMPYGDAV